MSVSPFHLTVRFHTRLGKYSIEAWHGADSITLQTAFDETEANQIAAGINRWLGWPIIRAVS